MRIDVLNGAATIELGNPNSIESMIAHSAVLGGNDAEYMQTLAFYFSRVIAGLEAVSVNDKEHPDALLLWELWSGKESDDDYAALFKLFRKLNRDLLFELNEACNQAVNVRYRAAPELQVADESLLDPKVESAAPPS